MSERDEEGVTPDLRFSEFRNAGEWKVTPFAMMFEIGGGKDYKHLRTGDIPVYGSGGYMLAVDGIYGTRQAKCRS
ncbi:MAG: type I restriction enzyme S subunit [Marinomonas primoryensis]|jgi:type I restriction enzyme S subunit